MKKNINYFLQYITLLLILLVPTLVMAQGDPGGDPGVPFDGGASLLVAAGTAYGVKKYRERKSRKSEESVDRELGKSRKSRKSEESVETES